MTQEKLSLSQKIRNKQGQFDRWLDERVFDSQWEDGAFMDDVRQATLRGAHPAANLLFKCLVCFVVCFILWANIAKLDEVTRGDGAVVPSGKVQVVQNLEGGIVKEILVRQWDVVDKGDILLIIDDTGFASSLEEKKKRYLTLQAQVIRLQAESEGRTPIFPEKLKGEAPEIVVAAHDLFTSRRAELKSAETTLQRQVDQRRQEIAEAKERQKQTQRSWELANQEYQMAIPLERQGVISRVELLRLEREVNDLKGEKESARLSVPRAQAALKEVQSRLDETVFRAQNEARQELKDAQDEFNRLEEILKAEADKVDRTTVRAPVRAEVKQVSVNTVGGVIQPGMDLVELIPLDDTLLVEAQVRPQDIAFLRPGQEATVKITAYDFAIYGGLDGHLEQISPDTIANEDGEAFYKIRVRTQKNYLGDQDDKLPIISGMVASVDILTGKKTVMDYLLKPLRRARERALKER